MVAQDVKVFLMHGLIMDSFISPHTEKRRSDCYFKKVLTTRIHLVVQWRVYMYTDDKKNIKVIKEGGGYIKRE